VTSRTYSVGELADLASVSVRTLHHYDAIGLLSPTERTAAGHRRYGAPDLERLHTILFYRALEFGLDEIASMLADPGRGTDAHLRNQHRMLRERIGWQQHLLAALEKEMEARQMGMSLTPEEQFEVFGTDKVSTEWADEARERWGESDAYKESQRRTTKYSKADWVRLKEEADEGLRAFAAAFQAGTPASSDAAREFAEQHRQYISRWFYDCGYELHRGLAEMYVADDRFRATYDAVAPGLAQYVSEAIIANCDAATS
jgi:MerR family transcriptional regulator, thiopeptide resistance regulator